MLQRCVHSVLGQTFQDWVHVIVNDGGDPAAVRAVLAPHQGSYGDRLQVIHNEDSKGMQNASNIAIRASRSECLVIHDDDDSWHPQFLRECLARLDEEGPESTYRGVVTQSIWIFEEITAEGEIRETSRRDYYPFEDASLFRMASGNLYPPIAFLYRRDVHDEIGYFDQQFNELGDWDFNLRFLRRYDIAVLDRRLANYHWRYQAGGNVYGNTVTDGVSSHREHFVMMQNHYLRRDMDEGGFGLGLLMNISKEMKGHAGLLWDISGKLGKLDTILEQHNHFTRITSDLTKLWKFKSFLARWSTYLRAKVLPQTLKAPGSGEASPTGHCSWRAEDIPAVPVVSMDVFDTALLRLVKQPVDVFLFMQEEARRLVGRDTLLFPAVRVQAERTARQRALETTAAEDVSLEGIYEVFCELAGIEESHVKALADLELQTEEKLLYPNPLLSLACRALAGRGSRVIFTSDMYLPRNTIRDLLRRNGFEAEEIYVSSEIGKTKFSGTLFDHVLEECGCRPQDVLHIGDNAVSDVARPESKGIRTLAWNFDGLETPLVDQQESFAGAWEGDVHSSLYTGLVRRHRYFDSRGREGDLEDRLGYEVFGPHCLAFVSWVAEQAQAHGVKKLFFLSRDGFYLIQAFRMLAEARGLSIEADYLYASRRLLNVPRIRALDEHAMAFLLSPNPSMCVRHFLERVGIDAERHRGEIERFGLGSLDRLLIGPWGAWISVDDYHRMHSLFLHLEGRLLDLAGRERGELLAYFGDVEFEAGEIAVVDMGWQATSVKSLQDLLNFDGGDHRLRGYYFGTWGVARGAIEDGCRVDSFFFHLDKPHRRSQLVGESVEMLESFFGAPHPTIVGVKKEEGRWEPLYGEEEVGEEEKAFLTRTAESGLEFVREALEIVPSGSSPPPFGYLETVLDRLLRRPTLQEAVRLGGISMRNTFGGNGPIRHLALLPPERERYLHPHTLQEAYNYCYWKKGFLAQLSPQERSLLVP